MNKILPRVEESIMRLLLLTSFLIWLLPMGGIAQEPDVGGGLTTPIDYWAIEDAVERAKSLDPADIRGALAKTKEFQGITGEITIDENGDPVNKSAVILKFGKDAPGYWKTITPQD